MGIVDHLYIETWSPDGAKFVVNSGTSGQTLVLPAMAKLSS